MNRTVRPLYIMLLLLLPYTAALCQEPEKQSAETEAPLPDTSYYQSYTHLITTRYFFSQKYTSMTMNDKTRGKGLQYRPNTNLTMGVGVTYGWFTLNLGFVFPFLNTGDDAKGKTKYLDLQSHIYTRNYIVDVLATHYRGYYLYPEGAATSDGHGYYQRQDLKVWNGGISAYKILNAKKYSFRAAMQQNEWQKKSAGSFLLGAEILYGRMRSDSSIVPTLLQKDYNQSGITSIRCLDIGPGAGYAYTFVIKKHFYLMGSATCTLPLEWLTEYRDDQSDSKISVNPNISYRASAGYNTSRWGVSALWVNNSMDSQGISGHYQVQTGNVRLNLIYRFMPGKKLQRKIRFFSMN